jgi:hypothetical protein
VSDEEAVPGDVESAITLESPRGGSLRRAATLTALAGIIHAVLFLVSLALLSTVPGPTATDEEVIAFYNSPETRRVLVVGLYLMPFAGIAFLWFIVSMRLWFRSAAVRARSELFAEVQLVSGIVFLALFLVAAAATSSTAAAVEFTDEPVTGIDARILPNFGSTLLLVLAMRMAAIFVISSTSLARSSPFIPRWFVIAGYLLGLFLLLSVSLSTLLVLAFPAWIIVFCLLLLERARHIPHGVPIQAGLMNKHLDELGASSAEERARNG